MATSLLLACDFNDQPEDSYIHISEESDADGSFLISSILGQRLRMPNSSVVLVCLQNTFTHYFNAGMRLGYNLNIFKNKSLSVIEPNLDLYSSFSNLQGINAYSILQYIRENIQNKLNSMSSKTIIIDNLEILLNLGISKEDLIKLPQSFRAEGAKIMIVAKLGNSNLFDVVNNVLINSSDLHIKIVPLKSGKFKEVDGKLIVNKTSCECPFEIKKHEKHILYKVGKNIKIFNPGEIGVKV